MGRDEVICLLYALMLLGYVGAGVWAIRCLIRQSREPLVSFVRRTGRLCLTKEEAWTHYQLPFYAALLPVCFSGLCVYDWLMGESFSPQLFPGVWIVLGFTLLALLFGQMQYRRLRCVRVTSSLSAEALVPQLTEVAFREEWTIDHVDDDCFLAHTNPSLWSGSWGEQIFVVFDRGQVWINSICDLNKRPSVTSFGRTSRHIRLLARLITSPEGSSKDR